MDNALKSLRRDRKITQSEMAEKVGVKLATYGTWERGERMFSAAQLLRCAEILDCSTDAILCHEVPTEFDDWREAELHKVWRGLDAERQDRLLDDARDMALAQGARAAPHEAPQEGVA